MYKSVSANKFVNHYEHAYRQLIRMQESCTSPAGVDWGRYSFYLEEDGNSGYAIAHVTDELCCVWSRFAGRGDALVADAVSRGAVCLTCFDGYLPTLYTKHGFVEESRRPNWRTGGPDFLVMKREVF